MIDKGGVIIVDVREENEYNEGHIENAILLPVGQIEKDAQNILPDLQATIIVYCRTGRRSASAAEKLVKLGYENVYDLGGILAWKNSGYDVSYAK
jgi:rhodanese-related sulfurtransferase